MNMKFIIPMLTAIQFLNRIHGHCSEEIKTNPDKKKSVGFWSKENPKIVASGSELRRWIQQSVLHINAEAVKVDEMLDFPIFSVILFPKNDSKRITIF